MKPEEVRAIVERSGMAPKPFAIGMEFPDRSFRYYIANRPDKVEREPFYMYQDESGDWHVPLYLEFALRWIDQEVAAGRNPLKPSE